MSKRALVIVLDSVGCGNAPDAGDYGDSGADTLGNLFRGIEDLNLPGLASLGLLHLLGIDYGEITPNVRCSKTFRLTETSSGKDTTTGHWELMGLPTTTPLFTCESFPSEFVSELESLSATSFLGNKAASGTDILRELGEEHCRTGYPILYTSADSVLQIAAHEENFGLERLYEVCQKARDLLDERGLRVGRVIARPFLGFDADSFQRTSNRHDYSLTPERTVLNDLQDRGVTVIGIGKISDIFAGSGISQSFPTPNNLNGMHQIDRIWDAPPEEDHFIFCNLVDFDSLYGHRRDPRGYADCLMAFDRWLVGFLKKVNEEDLVMITADHGNDPYYKGTDHTREQVPCLRISGTQGVGPGMSVFSDVAKCVEQYFIGNEMLPK